MVSSYGCIIDHRDDDYGRHREYREQEEHRGGDYDRDYDSVETATNVGIMTTGIRRTGRNRQ